METIVYGKCIIAGEHAVIRGAPALVFPVFSRALKLSFEENQHDLSVEFSGPHGDELRLLFWGVIERALEMKKLSRNFLKGQFRIHSTVPVGAGLGASATLCVGIGRWMQSRGWVNEEELVEFCRQLENLFHGESSGVDIAVAVSGRGLHFERQGARYAVDPKWQPHWFISYSGKRGVTSECVARVKALWETDAKLAAAIDDDMKTSVQTAERALTLHSGDVGFESLVQSIHLARSCFDRWGLSQGEIGRHMQILEDAGAVAVKPTGSGDGGFVLSLWDQAPPESLQSQLIRIGR